MKTKSALIWSDSRVKLNTETTVYLCLAIIINPRHTENNLSLRLNDTLENTSLNEVRSSFNNWFQRGKYLHNCLNELWFTSVSLFYCFQ